MSTAACRISLRGKLSVSPARAIINPTMNLFDHIREDTRVIFERDPAATSRLMVLL